MRQNKFILLCFLLLFILLDLKFVHAAILGVAPSSSACDALLLADPSIEACYTSIQSAIDEGEDGDTIEILPQDESYIGNITLNKNISIRGVETARTVITSGTGTGITVTGVTTTISIRRIYFKNNATGISVQNTSASVLIQNNIFDNNTGIAVQVQNEALADIANNTFYDNGTAIVRDKLTISIINNIFSVNATNIEQGSLADNNISFNCFHTGDTAGTDSIPNTDFPDPDPKFVDAPQGNFQLKAGSPCIDNGSSASEDPPGYPNRASDIGAYGGPNTDTIPFQVAGVTATVSGGGPPYTITVSWDPNESYRVTETNPITLVTGGYHIYYRASIAGPPYGGTGAAEGISPVDVGLVTSDALSNLPDAPPPTAPVLDPNIQFADSLLKPTWSAVTTATRYRVYYWDLFTVPEPFVDVGNVTTTELRGLTNGTTYRIQVTAFAPNAYYLSVTAYDNSVQTPIPGIQHESAFLDSVEVVVDSNDIEGPRSNAESEFPDRIGPLPEGLPNEGCFIATAAYGHYSSQQVRTLRDFRDRYLLTNTPGRAFVRWYYTHGPIAARFINEHPWLKPVVRAALLPAVSFAAFMMRTPAEIAMITFLFITLILVLVARRTAYRIG